MADQYLKRKKRFENDADLEAVTSGGSLGFADELAGVGNALAGALQKGTLSDFKKDYQSGKEYDAQKKKQAYEANPERFTAINTAMQIPSMAVGGPLSQMALGVASGIGNSDRTGTGLIQDAALGGGISGLMGKLKLPGKALTKVARNTPIPQTIDTQAYLKALARLAGS